MVRLYPLNVMTSGCQLLVIFAEPDHSSHINQTCTPEIVVWDHFNLSNSISHVIEIQCATGAILLSLMGCSILPCSPRQCVLGAFSSFSSVAQLHASKAIDEGNWQSNGIFHPAVKSATHEPETVFIPLLPAWPSAFAQHLFVDA